MGFRCACLRQTSDVIEAQGVEISRSLVHDADVVLYLVDSQSGLNDEDREFIEKCNEPLIVVETKIDKNSENTMDESSRSERLSTSVCRISSKTGAGLSELFTQITKILTAGVSTERTQAGLGSARQKEAVSEALECVRHALISADDNYTLDAVVQDLEDALDFLGEVTGDVTPDDVLGSIFANFCVGK